ncbi:plasminogen activator inhibitor 1-like isoform X2 [Polyodon spathula]|nr:plasminogen activator inhibitor 1-like isoform X2 [Polyodon spathula]
MDSDFGMRVFREALRSPAAERNLVFSPYGLSTVMGMVQLGAAGQTYAQVRGAMGYAVEDRWVPQTLRKICASLSGEGALQTASAAFVHRKLRLEKPFRHRLAKVFQQLPKQVDFRDTQTATAVVNRWVSDNTMGMLPHFLSSDALSSETRLLLLNAIHFQGRWKVPFEPQETRERLFHCANGSSMLVPMMQQTARFQYGEFVTPDGVDYDVIELPYEGDTMSMLLLSPFEKDVPLSALTAGLSGELLREWRRGLRRASRQLALPRFSIETESELNGALAGLGMRDMFNQQRADFTRVTMEEPLFVSKVLQKVKIEVDEKGTKGAAATAAILFSRMAVEEITLDRPFLFLVQHKPTGAVLFLGQVMEPAGK